MQGKLCIDKKYAKRYLFWLIILGLTTSVVTLSYLINRQKKAQYSTTTKASSETDLVESNLAAPTIMPYNPVPNPPDLSLSFWASVLSRYPDASKQLDIITKIIPDPLMRSRIAEVFIDNVANLNMIARWNELVKMGKVFGHTLCGDSRVVCDTLLNPTSEVVPQTAYYGLEGGQYAIVEQRSLGAAPRVYSKGINLSMVSVHCNSAFDPTGCGALNAFERINQLDGKDYLLKHGVDQSTIDEIARSIASPDPFDEAVVAAKVQAKINSFEHGGVPHITVAAKIGHADRTMEIIDAFDELGGRVSVPQVIKDFVTINNRGVQMGGAIDSVSLAKGQAPYEYVLDSTGFNIQDILGRQAGVPGRTFKITSRPQSIKTIASKDYPFIPLISDVDQAIAGINYPLAHPWGKLQWILAQTPEEAALIRERMLLYDPAWKFLGNQGVIVEAVVGADGKINNSLKITKLADIGGDIGAMKVNALRKMSLDTREVALSTKTLGNMKRMADEAAAVGGLPKTTGLLQSLMAAGKYTLRVLQVLQPVLDGVGGYFTYDWIREHTNLKLVYDLHTQTENRMYAFGLTYPFGAGTYKEISDKFSALPYLITQTYKTTYTRKELAEAFTGLLDYYKLEVAGSGLPGSQGNWTSGSKNINSPFFGVAIKDLYKILVFDFFEKETGELKKLSKDESPLIYFPLLMPEEKCSDVQRTDCWPHYDDINIPNSEIIIMNINTGEFLTTDLPGEMLIKTKEINEKQQEANAYLLHLKSDGKGNISVLPVAYGK